MVTINPAKILKISNKKGEIMEGMDADITIFDKDLNILMTIIEGNIGYKIF